MMIDGCSIRGKIKHPFYNVMFHFGVANIPVVDSAFCFDVVDRR